MIAIQGEIRGDGVVLPATFAARSGAKVMVIVEESDVVRVPDAGDSRADWISAQRESMRKAWDNDEDAGYDHL